MLKTNLSTELGTEPFGSFANSNFEFVSDFVLSA